MIILYIFSGIIAAGLLIKFFWTKKENNSPYLNIKKKLEDDLMQANFSGDWRKRQEISLQLLWLKTLYEVESNNMFRNKKGSSETTLLAKLSYEDIRFPTKWKLDDFYCYPFSQEIIVAYGKILAENDYKGMFKPDSILPVPKTFIRKAILFTFDYFNLKEPMYEVTDKDKRADNLNGVNVLLDKSFINTENEDLPKSGVENYKVGNEFKERQKKYSEIEDLKLIDWRTDTNWIVRGAQYADKEQYDFSFACYDLAKKINPDNTELEIIIGTTYLIMGERYFDKGEKTLAIDYIKKSAELQNEEAIEWLKQNK